MRVNDDDDGNDDLWAGALTFMRKCDFAVAVTQCIDFSLRSAESYINPSSHPAEIVVFAFEISRIIHFVFAYSHSSATRRCE